MKICDKPFYRSDSVAGLNHYLVWVIAPQSITEAEEKTDFLEEQTQLVTRAQSGLSIAVTNAMVEASNVEDKRN